MFESEEEFLEGKPGIFEIETEDGKFSTSFDRAYYSVRGGRFSFIIEQSGVGKEYKVLYEDITKNEDGTLSFEYMDTIRTVRRFKDEDGIFLMQYEMPFPVEYIEKMMEMPVGVEQSIKAFSDPETGEVKELIYDIGELGAFFRSEGFWSLSDEGMTKSLDNMKATPLSFQSAKNTVAKWDAGSKINISEVNPDEELEE